MTALDYARDKGFDYVVALMVCDDTAVMDFAKASRLLRTHTSHYITIVVTCRSHDGHMTDCSSFIDLLLPSCLHRVCM